MHWQTQPRTAQEPETQPVPISSSSVLIPSAMFTHGLRYPVSMQAARETALGVQAGGATPVFTGIVAGTLRIGLSQDEMELLFSTPGVMKAAARDMPFCMARGLNAGTTLSAALSISSRAGIDVIATGAMGGVHRDYDVSMDASTDITELARRRGIVVCSGTQPVADARRTLEMLETVGVPVVGYKTSEFPGFYSASSGLRIEHQIDEPEEIVAYYKHALRSGLSCAVLLMVPVPADVCMPAGMIESMVSEASHQARSLGISGKELAPFLLTALEVLSGGKTLLATTALLRNNAYVAGQIAAMLGKSR